MKSIARNLSVSRALPIFVGVFFCSYLFFSVLMPSNSNINISAKTPAQYKILAEIFGTPAEAGHSWISTRLNTDFSCPAGSTGVTYQNNPPDVGIANDQAQWFACYASPTALAGLYPSAPLLQQYFGPGWSGAGCESGSVPHVYNNYVGNDYDAIWVACSSPTPVPAALPPAKPDFTPTCVSSGSSWNLTLNWSPVLGAENYPVRISGPAPSTAETIVGNGGFGQPVDKSLTSYTFNVSAPGTYLAWMHAWNANGWSAHEKKPVDCLPPVVPVPPAPPEFTASCNSSGQITTDSFYTTGATAPYHFRLDDPSTGTNPDILNDNYTGTSYSGTGIAGRSYDIWVHACNASGCSGARHANGIIGPSFSCPAVAVTYSCTDATPANANICANDDSGLTANTNRTLVSSCTSGTKCEYVCSTGYVYSGGTCVLAGGGGAPAPTVTLSANPTSLPFGGGTTRLTWSTMNATSCSASGSWSGSKATGSGIWQDIPLSASGTYTFNLECWNSASVSTGVQSATVTVAAAGGGGSFISPPAGYCVTSPSPPNYADCSTWAKPTGLDPKNYFIVNHGAKNMTSCQESVIAPGTWITNVSMCYGSGCWSGSSPQTSSGQYEVATSYVSGTSYTYRCNSSTNIVEQNSGGGWSNVIWSSTSQPIKCVEVNTCSVPLPPTEPVTTTLEVVCTPITCGSLAGVAATYCTTDTFSTPDPCGGSITCPGTKSCSNSDANWREVAP